MEYQKEGELLFLIRSNRLFGRNRERHVRGFNYTTRYLNNVRVIVFDGLEREKRGKSKSEVKG